MAHESEIKPGQRVVLRPGAPYGTKLGDHVARIGGKSITATLHLKLRPKVSETGIVYDWDGHDAQGIAVYFRSADAEIAGPLP